MLQGYDLPGLQSQEAKCEQVFQRVKNIADSCYPSETALPLDHIVSRLEQMSAGAWPVRQSPLDDHTCVADAMVQVCLYCRINVFRSECPSLLETTDEKKT